MKLKVKPIIRIAPHSYTLYFDPNIVGDESRDGLLHHRTQAIAIYSLLPPTRKEVTFWHEVFHGLQSHFSLNMSEEAVDNLAVGITQFLQENFDIELDFSDIKIREE